MFKWIKCALATYLHVGPRLGRSNAYLPTKIVWFPFLPKYLKYFALPEILLW